jgi:hypothetical protein
VSNILLSTLNRCTDEITWDHQRGFQYSKSTADQIFFYEFATYLGGGGGNESTSVIHELKKAYDFVRGEVLYNILIDFGVPMKLLRMNKI